MTTQNTDLTQQALIQNTSQSKWNVFKTDTEQVEKFASKSNLPPILAKYLIFHGIGSADSYTVNQFLHSKPSLNKEYRHITDPKHLKRSLIRMADAIKKKELIFINGDSDADGISGCCVFLGALLSLGAKVDFGFPVRSREGHGLQLRLIDEAIEKGAGIILTTDCGTKDIEAVDYANSKGLDVIICDHHILGKQLPQAHAIVNPHMLKTDRPEKKLSGAGLSFKLMVGLSKHLDQRFPKEAYDFMLVMASLGTISDRVSLLEPINRVMVSSGISAFNNNQLPGLQALKDISFGNSSKSTGKIRARDVSRTISPRLNAPGRIGDPELGIPDSNIVVDLLLVGVHQSSTPSQSGIKKYIRQFLKVVEMDKQLKKVDAVGSNADMVDKVNEKRKRITEKIEKDIQILIREKEDIDKDKVIVLRGHDWNSGVIGIDADRLRDRFNRPAILLTSHTGTPYMKGSVRSIPSINMYAVLESIQEQFIEEDGYNPFIVESEASGDKKIVSAFGGHAQACGFALHEKDYDLFVSRVYQAMESIDMSAYAQKLDVLETLSFSQININFLQQLDRLSPFGQCFDVPLFLLEKCRIGVNPRPFGNKYQEGLTPHVEFTILESIQPSKSKGNRQRIKKLIAVGFGLWDKFQETMTQNKHDVYDIIFSLDDYRGKHNKSQIRLIVKDIRRSTRS